MTNYNSAVGNPQNEPEPETAVETAAILKERDQGVAGKTLKSNKYNLKMLLTIAMLFKFTMKIPLLLFIKMKLKSKFIEKTKKMKLHHVDYPAAAVELVH